ncbi:MAG: glycosyltransferase family 4 protein [Gammaproteobacteria bacterium]
MSSAEQEAAFHPLTIIELCLSKGRGGLEHYAADLVPALGARGHRVVVVAEEDNEFGKRAGQPIALTLPHHRYLRWFGARQLGKLAREANADVIHIHRSADLPLAVLAKRSAGNRPALVYSRHMLITRDRRTSLAHRYMFRHVDRMLPITEQIAAVARKELPIAPERVQALAPGVAPVAGTEDCERIRPPACDFVVGCFSRVEPAKGQHQLIEAIAKLREHGVKAGAVFAGSVMNPPYDAALHRQVKTRQLDAAVRFLGTLADARPVMPCCDVVAMPSTGEALGLVMVEAMLMGVPVVASAAGGVLEYVRDGETGLTYPVGDVAALAERLERLARDPAFAHSLARAGREAAGECFDRDRHLARLEAIFRDAVAERAADRRKP